MSAVATSPVHGGEIGKIRSFLLDHEKLLIVFVAAILLWWGYGKYADIRLQHDNAVLAQAKLASEAQAKVVAAQAAQVQQDAQQLQALQTKLEAQNAQLAQANATLAAALSQRQKTDAALPPTELAARWKQLVPDAQPVGTASGFSLSVGSAVATVQSLEQVPALKQELANETQLKTNGDLLIAQQQKNIFDLTGQVGGLQKQSTLDKQQCTDEKNVMKSEFRKSKRRWFIIGYVAGFVSRQVIKSQFGF